MKIFANKWIAVILVVMLVGFGAIGFIGLSSWMDTKIVMIKPEDVPEDLYKPVMEVLAAQLAGFEKEKIWKISLKSIEETIRKEPRVKDVRVMRSWPGDIQVKIWPYQPIMVILDDKGKLHPVTKDARLLNAIPIRESGLMPVARGAAFLAQKELRQTAVLIVDTFEKEESLKGQEISEITFTQKEGFRMYLTKSGTEVRLGDSDFGLKLKRVGKVVAYLDGQYIKGRVIDARYSKKVLVRVRNAP